MYKVNPPIRRMLLASHKFGGYFSLKMKYTTPFTIVDIYHKKLRYAMWRDSSVALYNGLSKVNLRCVIPVVLVQ